MAPYRIANRAEEDRDGRRHRTGSKESGPVVESAHGAVATAGDPGKDVRRGRKWRKSPRLSGKARTMRVPSNSCPKCSQPHSTWSASARSKSLHTETQLTQISRPPPSGCSNDTVVQSGGCRLRRPGLIHYYHFSSPTPEMKTP